MAIWDGKARFDRQLKEHLPRALRLAIRLTGDLDRGEEVAQEAMVRAARSWRSYRGDGPFGHWLNRIVVHAFRDQLSRRRTSGELSEEPVDERGAEPSEMAMASELGEMVAARISSLPPRQREVIVLAAYEGMEADEIAAALGITSESVYSNLHLARTRLKRWLAPYLAEK